MNHTPIIIMKVGFHGKESLDRILERKQLELSKTGICYWGYGGTVCHPTKAILPCLSSLKLGEFNQKVEVYFIVTPSPFHSEMNDAVEYSQDGVSWQPIPEGVRVSASHYALVLNKLEVCEEFLNLSDFVVAYGPSKGKRIRDYLRSRVDKALAIKSIDEANSQQLVRISLKATLTSPYAVLLRH